MEERSGSALRSETGVVSGMTGREFWVTGTWAALSWSAAALIAPAPTGGVEPAPAAVCRLPMVALALIAYCRNCSTENVEKSGVELTLLPPKVEVGPS